MSDPGHPRGSFRNALRGLTTRGRSFLAAGITAAVCAYLLGQPALLRVGVLLAVLPLAAAGLLLRTRYRVASGRRLSPTRTPAGEEARVHLRVDNVSRVPTGLLMLEDQVPYVLGSRPRFVLDRIEPHGHREVSYRVRSDLRGRYPLGPLQLRLSDPFGMCELTRSFAARDTLTVVPKVHRLPIVRLGGEATGHGDSRSRAVALAGEDDVVPRGYRHGDDLRRVHWRSTAKYGELMVRREEQPLRSRATVLLDTRARGHRGSGTASSFEWAVSAAASIGLHLMERGYAARVLTDTGHSIQGSPAFDGPVGGAGEWSDAGSAADSAGLLLDSLAVLRLSDGGGLRRAEEVLRTGGEGLLVAVLGALDDEETAALARLRRRSAAAVALLLDTPAWAGPEAAAVAAEDHRSRLLLAEGWSVVPVRPGDALPDVWRGLGRSGGAGAARWAAPGPAAARPAAAADAEHDRWRPPAAGRAPSPAADGAAADGAAEAAPRGGGTA